MLLYEHSKPTEYPAELSAWGPPFFRELATVSWSEATGIVVTCSRELRRRSTVYLRLLSIHGTRGPALPYRIRSVATSPASGWTLVLTPFPENNSDLGLADDDSAEDLGSGDLIGRPISLDQICREHILRVLHACGGNRSRAAQILEIGRTSLYRFLLEEKKGERAERA